MQLFRRLYDTVPEALTGRSPEFDTTEGVCHQSEAGRSHYIMTMYVHENVRPEYLSVRQWDIAVHKVASEGPVAVGPQKVSPARCISRYTDKRHTLAKPGRC